MKAQKTLVLFLTMALVVFGFGAMAQAGDTATQTVTFDVPAINEITVSGDPAKLVITAPAAGSLPADVTNALTTYSITTNETGKKITAKIDSAMPTGTTLIVNLDPPSVGTSAGDVTLLATDTAVVTGIGQVADSAKTITYTLHADLTSGGLLNQSKTVTFTIADES